MAHRQVGPSRATHTRGDNRPPGCRTGVAERIRAIHLAGTADVGEWEHGRCVLRRRSPPAAFPPRSHDVFGAENRHLPCARSCQSEVLVRGRLRRAAYFDEPFYVGFQIGGFELGLDTDVSGVNVGNSAVAYWGVANIAAAYRSLIDQGAESRQPVRDVGGDIKVAEVADPFGNVIGLIQNPHFSIEP